MNGIEHYSEAQRLLKAARDTNYQGTHLDSEDITNFLAAAQVHATLATAAAMADLWGHHTLHDEPAPGEVP